MDKEYVINEAKNFQEFFYYKKKEIIS